MKCVSIACNNVCIIIIFKKKNVTPLHALQHSYTETTTTVEEEIGKVTDNLATPIVYILKLEELIWNPSVETFPILFNMILQATKGVIDDIFMRCEPA